MLFGHQNDDVTQPAGTPPPPPPSDDLAVPTEGVNPLAIDRETGASLPVAPSESSETSEAETSSVLDQPTPDDAATAPVVEPETPAIFDSPVPAVTNDDSAVPTDETTAGPVADDLLALKQQALTQLSPLVSQLDQTPEEKFRTTMMLLQSTDNSALIKDAYEAAQSIPDEKTRAQALLDVVNEINYFTQQK